jgi:hypothetical protein
VVLSELQIEAHQCFEGGTLIARWVTFKGPTLPYDKDTNAVAVTRLRTPWRRGLLLEKPSTPKAAKA